MFYHFMSNSLEVLSPALSSRGARRRLLGPRLGARPAGKRGDRVPGPPCLSGNSALALLALIDFHVFTNFEAQVRVTHSYFSNLSFKRDYVDI